MQALNSLLLHTFTIHTYPTYLGETVVAFTQSLNYGEMVFIRNFMVDARYAPFHQSLYSHTPRMEEGWEGSIEKCNHDRSTI